LSPRPAAPCKRACKLAASSPLSLPCDTDDTGTTTGCSSLPPTSMSRTPVNSISCAAPDTSPGFGSRAPTAGWQGWQGCAGGCSIDSMTGFPATGEACDPSKSRRRPRSAPLICTLLSSAASGSDDTYGALVSIAMWPTCTVAADTQAGAPITAGAGSHPALSSPMARLAGSRATPPQADTSSGLAQRRRPIGKISNTERPLLPAADSAEGNDKAPSEVGAAWRAGTAAGASAGAGEPSDSASPAAGGVQGGVTALDTATLRAAFSQSRVCGCALVRAPEAAAAVRRAA